MPLTPAPYALLCEPGAAAVFITPINATVTTMGQPTPLQFFSIGDGVGNLQVHTRTHTHTRAIAMLTHSCAGDNVNVEQCDNSYAQQFGWRGLVNNGGASK